MTPHPSWTPGCPTGSGYAALPPLASPGTLISLRVPAQRRFDLDRLVDAGSVSEAGAEWLRAMMSALRVPRDRIHRIGKDDRPASAARGVPADERIVAIEESAELQLRHPHFVRLETRIDNAEGRGRVDMTDLMRQALRMRPDRVVVGEVRGAEVTALLNAMNTGHEGSCGTVHANDVAASPPASSHWRWRRA